MKKINCLLFTIILVGCSETRMIQTQATSTDQKMNDFISELMGKMTIEEKIGQLNLVNPGGAQTGSVFSANVEAKVKAGQVGGMFGVIGVDRIRKAQEVAVTQTRLKIPMMFGSDVIHGHKTTWPIPLGLSCSWDIPMIERSARIAAKESTADGLNWVFSPMVDISRDPRWGRVAEAAGEDPYLGSLISAAMVRGYQGNNLAADSTLMACVKHFALYGAAEGGRDYNTTDMSRLYMHEYFLPPYKAAVDAGVGSVMTSFNEIDGVPASGNRWLLTQLLRNQWGFNGFVVTDYTAINEMIDHGSGNLQQVSAMALKAGSDMDMVGEGFLTTLKKSLDEGKVTMQEIDLACRRVLEAKYKLGLFDDPYRYTDSVRAKREVLSMEKRQAAREFGARSTVLIKNNNQTLPLKKSGTIALIGPLANDKVNMLGTWAVSGNRETTIPVWEGMRNVGGSGLNITYSKGANITDDTALAKKSNPFGPRVIIDSLPPERLLSDAIANASRADVIVAVVGEASEMSGEASSRSDIGLPGNQTKLLEELAKTGKPLVIVMMSGRPLAISKEVEMATSFLHAWFLGDEAGNAIADVLFGNYNPSGKLTMSFPYNVGQVPIYYNHKNTGRPQGTGPTQKFRSNYLDVGNDPFLPFGYGLSYTTFNYSDLRLDRTSISVNDNLRVSINVTNSGRYDGEEVVQLYIHDKVASVTQPVKKLKAFQKIMIRAGETKEIVFNLSTEELKFYNGDLQWVFEPGEFTVMVGGNSRDVKRADFTLTN
ncbi:MAG: beta-glucosidase BglX [Chitinophagaceae bacterium]